MVELAQTTLTQILIEFVQVLDLRNRRGPVPLQIIDAVFHAGFFIAAGDHTKQRIKTIMTGQSRIAIIQLTLTTLENHLGHGPGIVPPDFPRHTAKELKGLNHAGQDRFGPFRGHAHREGTSRNAPGRQENRYLPTAFGKVHVDMTEVGFQTSPRWMIQGNEGLPGLLPPSLDIPADLVIPT